MVNKLLAGFEDFITEEKLTDDEVIIIKWQYGYFGSFYKSLIASFLLADEGNLARLVLAFPELGGALHRFKHEEGFGIHCEKTAELLKLNGG
jgi:hypothetical protein